MSVDPDDPTLKSSEVQEQASPIILGNKYVETNDLFTVQAQPDDSNISWQIIGNNFEYQSRSDEFSIPDNLEDGQYTLFASISANGRIAASSKIIVINSKNIAIETEEDVVTCGDECSFYPNPAINEITIMPGKEITGFCLNIKNISGKTVLTKSGINTGELKVDVSTLQNGIYFIELMSDNNVVYTKKLIKL
ncbi:MAG: T9SS type A sorting domain-containing protein [Prolixibacteraceae bacterium]|nr:T9SS type A sorting domain-containing protein [Prolixibacteraceae bacterium]